MLNMKILMDMIETIYLNHTFIPYNELDTLLKKRHMVKCRNLLKIWVSRWNIM